MGVYHPYSSGQRKVWESITIIQAATMKHGSSSPQHKRPHRSVGVHHPNSTSHGEAWESITPTQEGHIRAEDSITGTQKAG